MASPEFSRVYEARQEVASGYTNLIRRSDSSYRFDPGGGFSYGFEKDHQFNLMIFNDLWSDPMVRPFAAAIKDFRGKVSEYNADVFMMSGNSAKIIFPLIYPEISSGTFMSKPVVMFTDHEANALYKRNTEDFMVGHDVQATLLLKNAVSRLKNGLPEKALVMDDIVESGRKALYSILNLHAAGIANVRFGALVSHTQNDLISYVGGRDEDLYFFVIQLARALDFISDPVSITQAINSLPDSRSGIDELRENIGKFFKKVSAVSI